LIDYRQSALQVTDAVALDVQVVSGGPGPTLAVLGGVHGDEPEGILACDILATQLREASGLRGRVVIVPRANPPAVAANSRTNPVDGENLARVFPGDRNGTLTEKIADRIVREVIDGADGLIDLHSAGTRAIMPFFCGYHDLGDDGSKRAAAMADAFAAPITWAHDLAAPGRSLSAARSLGIPAIYAESGGGGQVIGTHLDGYVRGVRRVMVSLDMVDAVEEDEPPTASERRIVRGGYGDVDSAYPSKVAGRWVTRVSVGVNVAAGTVLGELRDGAGETIQLISAERNSCVMRLRRLAQVDVDDALAMVAPAAGPLSD
jgi:predicted deacylase